MNIKITDLDMILNHLETTSLEPHDDYSSEFTYKEQKILYKYIKQLQQRIDKAIDKLYCWGEVLDPIFQKGMLDILKENQNENN